MARARQWPGRAFNGYLILRLHYSSIASQDSPDHSCHASYYSVLYLLLRACHLLTLSPTNAKAFTKAIPKAVALSLSGNVFCGVVRIALGSQIVFDFAWMSSAYTSPVEPDTCRLMREDVCSRSSDRMVSMGQSHSKEESYAKTIQWTRISQNRGSSRSD